jgi:DNA-directed RNA polymerase subunit alpha
MSTPLSDTITDEELVTDLPQPEEPAPRGTHIELVASTARYGRFIIQPLEGGYGTTLGNALRRVLLSSLEGAAVTSIKLMDTYHEFTPISHAREDTTQLILNVKNLRFRTPSKAGHEWRLQLDAKGEGIVMGADVRTPPEVEIVNPEQHLLTLDSAAAHVQMELTVRRGKGYSPAEERGKLPLGELPVDAVFSPIKRVNYTVQKTRVGKLTDYDSLALEVWTDGTTSPHDALIQSAQILLGHFEMMAAFTGEEAFTYAERAEGIPPGVYETPIEELQLSVRAYNCLKRAGLMRVGEILDRLARGDEEMLVIRNFGQKSLDELYDALTQNRMIQYLPRTDDGKPRGSRGG